MRYVELLGLPGSGKSTLLRSLRRRAYAGRSPVKTVLSEDWAMVMRRFGYRGSGFHHGRTNGKFGPSGLAALKSSVHDCWQMGVFDEYPDLFANVFLSLKSVAGGGRQRAILLNYWRSRVSLYLDVSRSSSQSFCIVDEGLSQSLFSTVTRLSSRSEEKLELTAQMIRSLPSERIVVMLNTPIELIQSRMQSGERQSLKNLPRMIDELNFIFLQQEHSGIKTYELDGSLGVDRLCVDLRARLSATTGGQP